MSGQPELFAELLPPMEQKYLEWRETSQGQAVYREAVKRARTLQARGYRHAGIKMIWESLRYDAAVGHLADEEFKLNNNHHAFLSREIMRREPDLRGFFETRTQKSEGRAA